MEGHVQTEKEQEEAKGLVQNLLGFEKLMGRNSCSLQALYQKLKLEKLDEGRRVHETTTTPEANVPVEQEEKQIKIEEINKKLKTLHMYSSALNLLTLAGLMWHLWYLARRCVI